MCLGPHTGMILITRELTRVCSCFWGSTILGSRVTAPVTASLMRLSILSSLEGGGSGKSKALLTRRIIFFARRFWVLIVVRQYNRAKSFAIQRSCGFKTYQAV